MPLRIRAPRYTETVWAFFAIAASFCLFDIQDAAGQSKSALLRKTYRSQFLKVDREYWLYLPKGYDADAQKSWPVIYHDRDSLPRL